MDGLEGRRWSRVGVLDASLAEWRDDARSFLSGETDGVRLSGGGMIGMFCSSLFFVDFAKGLVSGIEKLAERLRIWRAMIRQGLQLIGAGRG